MTAAVTPSHLAFSDESKQNVGRYRSVALVTGTESRIACIREQMQTILRSSNVSEFKWERLKTRKAYFCAKKIVDLVVNEANSDSFRIDVLLWDTEDSRHRIQGRDDKANLGRMHYHLLRVVLSNRWQGECVWKICPDVNSAMDWKTLEYCLDCRSSRLMQPSVMLSQSSYDWEFIREYNILAIEERKSHEEPLIQIADFFAGLVIFSHESYDTYEQWITENTAAADFLGFENVYADRPSNAGKYRSEILHDFNCLCKKRKLRVSLKTRKGLITMDQRFPIVFWLWEPQSELDKAPVRVKEFY